MGKQQSTEKLALSIDEAADRAGVGRDKIYGAIRSGDLAAKKLGRRTLILADELRAWIDSLPAMKTGPADPLERDRGWR